MKSLPHLFCLLGVFLSSLPAFAASSAGRLEKGGATFDFKAASDRRFAESSEGAACVLSDWKNNYCYLHSSTISGSDPRRRKIRSGVDWLTEGAERVIVKKPELVEICGGADVAASVSGGWTATVKLPDSSGGIYRICFKYRMRHDVGTFGGLLLTPRLKKDAPAGAKAPGLSVHHLPDLWSEDGMWVKEVRIPPHCDRIDVIMRIDGVGALRFSDFAVMRQTFDTPVTVRFAPSAFIDGTFAFPDGGYGVMCVQWRKNDDTRYRLGNFDYELTLPRGYTLVEAVMADSESVKAFPSADGSTVWRMRSAAYAGGLPGSSFNGWSPLAVLVRADRNAPRGTAAFAAFYEGKRVSDTAHVEVFTVSAFRAVMPKRYNNGIYPGGPYCGFKTEAGREGFADILQSAGVTWMTYMHASPEVYALWRSKGVRFITPEWYHCANGFRVGDGNGRPDDQKYVTSATGHADYARATCPVAVYEEKSYFKEKVLPQLARFLEGADGLWANWEPYYFAGKGCFCDSCCRAFSKWKKLTYCEVKRDWPANMKYGARFGADAPRFRSWQHGQVVKTINRHVTRMTGGPASLGFIPGIAWCEMSSAWRPSNMAAEVQAIDYAGALKWIDPWGPYPWWSADSPYVEKSADMLSYWCAAKDVRKQVDADYRPPHRPKLMALPHAFQGDDAICQPEGISLAFDSFFFNGWEASIAYTFPKGFDARWWRAFAESTTRAAKYEDAVFDGVRVDGSVRLEPDSDFPAPAEKVLGQYLSWTKNVPYLQCAAYDHAGRRVCAVINFAHTAQVRFTLRAQGLKAGRYEVVDENGERWSRSDSGATFTAAELSSGGVRLALAPMRTKVFEIRPAKRDAR